MRRFVSIGLAAFLGLAGCWPNNPPSTPGVPSGPAAGFVDSSYTFTASAEDADGDSLLLVFAWGDGSRDTSGMVGSGQSATASHGWASPGTFGVSARAMDPDGDTSAWSEALGVAIDTLPGPFVPETPAGSDLARVGVGYVYSTEAQHPWDESLRVVFDWGDSSQDTTVFRGSGAGFSAVHFWSVPDTYAVRCRAVDADRRASGWSAGLAVTAYTLSPPGMPVGSDVAYINADRTYGAFLAHPEGKAVRFLFEWSDGETTGWGAYVRSGDTAWTSRSWSSPGTCSLRVRARDVDGVETGWSPWLVVVVQRDGTLKWAYENDWWSLFVSPCVGPDGTIYVGTPYLVALNPDGTVRWTFECGATSSPTCGEDGTIYFGGSTADGDALLAINPDGTLKWSFTVPGNVYCSPAIGTDGTLYFGSSSDSVYALNPDGTLKWAYWTGSRNRVMSFPAVGPDGAVYVHVKDGRLYAFAPDGTVNWTRTVGADDYFAVAIRDDGTVYYSSPDTGRWYVYAVNPDSTLKWRYPVEGEVTTPPVLGPDGTIYLGTRDGEGRLDAIAPDGTLKWSYVLARGHVRLTPALAMDGTIYFGTNGLDVCALNPDGTLKWRAYSWDNVYDGAISIGIDGTLYYQADNLTVALYGSSPLADSPWPKFQRDLQNSGRAR